jgi:hypothetical protein
MDLQELLRKGRHTMLSPVVYRTIRSMIVVSLAAVFFLVLLPVMAMAQEAYLVTAADGSLSAYDLATNNAFCKANSPPNNRPQQPKSDFWTGTKAPRRLRP